MKRRVHIITSWGVSEDERWVLEELRRLAKLEGLSMSKIITRAVKEYLQRHGEGNPQLTLKHERIRPFFNPPVERRRDLLADLLADIRSRPGQTVGQLCSEWGRVHGLREETVKAYLRQLRYQIRIVGSKVYPRH